jgi:hypothetical protein
MTWVIGNRPTDYAYIVWLWKHFPPLPLFLFIYPEMSKGKRKTYLLNLNIELLHFPIKHCQFLSFQPIVLNIITGEINFRQHSQ